MLSSRVFTIATLLVALLCVVASVSAAPLDSRAILRRHESQQELEADSIPVSSDGADIKKYNGEDKVPKKVKEEGNSAQGTGNGF